MPNTIFTISHTEAVSIIGAIIAKAQRDGGKPVAVAAVDVAGRLVAFMAMDNVMPASVKLAQSKAYSAVIGMQDTIHWASTGKSAGSIDFDMRNWTDENFSGFTGGVILEYNDQIIGGIAVSGRKGKMDNDDVLMQDHELAVYGKSLLMDL